jgi:hypothetical protein
MPTIEEVKEQAKMLAKENLLSEPTIEHIYWFPSTEEIRLVELTPLIPASGDRLEPFYFRAAPEVGLSSSSAIAMIQPKEFKQLSLPKGWGDWGDAVEILPEKQEASI